MSRRNNIMSGITFITYLYYFITYQVLLTKCRTLMPFSYMDVVLCVYYFLFGTSIDAYQASVN